MKKPGKTYKILYADKSEATSRGGLVFNNRTDADDYVKKANEENSRFHCWVEVMPESQADVDALLKIRECHER